MLHLADDFTSLGARNLRFVDQTGDRRRCDGPRCCVTDGVRGEHKTSICADIRARQPLAATGPNSLPHLNTRFRDPRYPLLSLRSRAPLRILLAIMAIALVLTRSHMGNTAFFVSLFTTGVLALLLFKERPRSVVVLIASLIVIDIVMIGSWVGIERVKQRIEQTSLAQETRDEVDVYSVGL